MNYEKWDEILAPYQHAVEELKVKFINIKLFIVELQTLKMKSMTFDIIKLFKY